jgi:thiamine-phosphate pyrophosphorylase
MNRSSAWPKRGLYLITPDEPDTARLLALAGPLLGLGVALLQYRNKAADRALRREQLQALLPACRAAGVPLLVNDDWRLAVELEADGAHLGRDDGDLAEARRWLGGDRILGVSCYGDLARAARAVELGADYLAFGAFHRSGSKPAARLAEPSLLRAAASFRLPRVAIGGISPDNARSLIASGADLLAVIGAVFAAPDPADAVRALVSCFEPGP